MISHDSAGATRTAPTLPASEVGLALVVAWCRDAPERTGELLAFAPGDREVRVFGRGDEPAGDPAHHRLTLVRRRPGGDAPAAPLDLRPLSREQLLLQRLDGHRLAVENRGRRALLVRGLASPHAIVRPGDVLQVEGLIVLHCITTSPIPAPGEADPRVATQQFGAADEDDLVGEGAAAWALRSAIRRLAAAPGPVLVLGADRACASLAARALHRHSPRSAWPLEVLDLGAFSADGLGPELFGQDGPTDDGTPGRLERATGGTLALEDLGAAAAALAPHLTRFMATGAFFRSGDPASRHADVRIVATFSGPPAALPPALRAAFTHILEVPALAQRREDLPLIAQHLLAEALAAHPDLRARFGDAAAAARIAPGFVHALLEASEVASVGALEAVLWQGLAASPGEWVIAPAGLAQRLVLEQPGEDTEGEGDAGTLPLTRASTSSSPATWTGPRPLVPEAEGIAAPAGTPPGDARLLPAGLPAQTLAGLDSLGRTERVVLQHLGQGRSRAEVARELLVSVGAVATQQARLRAKLGLPSDEALAGVALALARYLGPPPLPT